MTAIESLEFVDKVLAETVINTNRMGHLQICNAIETIRNALKHKAKRNGRRSGNSDPVSEQCGNVASEQPDSGE
jgi:hypothetical protein